MSLCPMCDGTGRKDHAGFAMEPCDHVVGDLSDAEVSRDEALKFLEHACRNWRQLGPLSESDLQDVADALSTFICARRGGGTA